MYATDGRTDRQTDGRTKAMLIAPSLPYGRGHNNSNETRNVNKCKQNAENQWHFHETMVCILGK